MGKDGESLENFASAMGAAFEVEVSQENIKEETIQKLFDEENLEDILLDWDDSELEDYDSPVLERLIDAGEGLYDGEVSSKELEKVLNEIERELEKTIKNFSERKETHRPSNFTEKEQVIRMEWALSLYRQALDEIHEYFEDGDKEHILDGLDMAQSAVNRLYRASHLTDEAEEGSRLKEKWLKPGLARMEHNESEVDLVLRSRDEYYTSPYLERIRQEISLLKAGKITKYKFSATLDWMTNNIKKAKAEYERPDIFSYDEKLAEMLEEISLSTERSLDLYEEAIKEMKRYFIDKNTSHLDKGIQKAFEANRLIAEIRKNSPELEAALADK